MPYGLMYMYHRCQLGPRYEGQLTRMAEPIPPSGQSSSYSLTTLSSSSSTDRRAETDRIVLTTRIINAELNSVYSWLCSNRLSLNVEKTKYVSFHTAQKTVIYPDLKINNIIIDRVAQFNFLGLIISSDLKWHKHIDHISLKISKVIGIMYRIKSILQANILLTMYNALIMPHFNYCLLAWDSNIKAGHKLHLLQKKSPQNY